MRQIGMRSIGIWLFTSGLLLALTACSAAPPIQSAADAPTPAAQAAAPQLVTPVDGSVFPFVEAILLEWRWDAPLAEDQYFDLRVWQAGQPAYGITWTKETRFDLTTWLREQYRTGTFYWQVALIRGVDGQLLGETSASAVFSFTLDRYLTATPTATPTLTSTVSYTPTPNLLSTPIGAALNDHLRAEYIARSEAYQTQLVFDETAAPAALAMLADTVRADFWAWLGNPQHVAQITDLQVLPIESPSDAYTMQAVTFLNANGLRVQGILSVPARVQPSYPVMIIPNGSAGSAAQIFGLADDGGVYRAAGAVFGAEYIVFAVEIPPTNAAADGRHFQENDVGFLWANAAGLNWEYYRGCDKVSSALDYLMALPQADLTRVGIYGISSGGTVAIMAGLCDDRITAVAASGTNVFTSSAAYLTGERGALYPHLYTANLARRPDYYQVLYALFPLPAIIELNAYDRTGDYDEALANARRVQAYYALQGAPDAVQVLPFADQNPPQHRMDVRGVKAIFDALFLGEQAAEG